MVMIIMTNAQMVNSSFERNEIFASNYSQIPSLSCGFLINGRPNFSTALNTKRAKKIQVLGLRRFNSRTIGALSKRDDDNRLVGGGFIEKEFEFKPSFDKYLKAMESVSTGRKQKKDNSEEKDVLRAPTPLLEKEEENVKMGKFEGHSRRKVSQVVKQDGLSEDFRRVMGQEGLVRGKFGERERESGEMKNESKMEMSEGYWDKGFARNGQGRFQDDLGGGESYVDVQVKRNVKGETINGRWLKNPISCVDKELKASMLGKGAKARRVHERSSVLDVAKTTSSSTDIGEELGNDENSSGILERKGSYGGQRDHKLKGQTFEIVKPGLKSSEMRKRYEKNHVQGEKFTEKKITLKTGTFSSSSKAFLKKSGDDNSEMERAAFKTFDAFNDIMDKPRVPKMEMEERIQKLAKWLNGADIDMPEWMFSKMMRSAKIRFTDHSILRVIQILGKFGNWRRVLQVIEWLQMHERFKSHKLRYIYTAALDVLGKARRPVEALNVFHAMQQQMSSYPDLVAYHCIAVTLGQAGHMKELFDVIDCMRSPPKKKFKKVPFEEWDPRLEPDIIVYNSVLNACVRRKQWEGAFWVLQQLKQQGQQPSSTTFGLVMEVMFACGKYNLVHEFFRKVQKSIPNALTYKVLVNTLWREGKTDEAVLAVQDMERRGIVGSAALYYDLARCLCSAGRCQEALMQIEKICKVANKPLVVTYTGLIQACLESGNIQNGAYIFHQMHGICSPNLVSYNIMLKGYLEHGMFEEAKKLFQKMTEDSNRISCKSDYKDRVIPDIYTFNAMLDACVAEKRWDDFEYFYKQMMRRGYHFNAKRHLHMILDASRVGKGELLETTWKHLTQADRIPPLSLIKERFCLKVENGDYAAAISCILSDPRSELQAFTKVAWLNLFKENAERFRKDRLVGLMHEVSILIARGDLPNPVFQNLFTSCKEFLRIHMTVVAEINRTETVSTVLKS